MEKSQDSGVLEKLLRGVRGFFLASAHHDIRHSYVWGGSFSLQINHRIGLMDTYGGKRGVGHEQTVK